LGRAVAGLAMGISYPIVPLYVAEVSPAKRRGLLTSMVEVLSNVGILMGYLSGWLCDTLLTHPTSWRTMLGIGVIPPLIVLLGVALVMLESPRWLAARGDMHGAQQVLLHVLGPLEARAVFADLSCGASVRDERGKEVMSTSYLAVFRKLLRSASLRQALGRGLGVAFFSQATGCETIVYYSGIILSRAGVAHGNVLLATVLMGCVKTATVLASGLIVDSYGRRPLLLASSLGMAFAMGLLSASSCEQLPVQADAFSLCLFVAAFSLGFGPIVYMYNAEIYPQSCRALGLSLAMGVCRIMSAVVSSTFLSLASLLSTTGTLSLYCVMGLAAAAFVALAVPETKASRLEACMET